MSIPAEFQYESEDDFIQKFIIPLVRQLGFSVVVNYHGTHEFGKDLVFGEIDRFGHVRYHALQAKYVDSISLTGVESLIADVRQAFANPFKHPHTGIEEKISSFYAVNGGSVSEQARTHFFNSLAYPFGGNLRLIDGVGLLHLDRFASAARSQSVTADLTGMLLELRYNRTILGVVRQPIAKKLGNDPSGYFPLERLRSNAVSRYIESPVLADSLSPERVQQYWYWVQGCNALMQGIGGFTMPEVRNNYHAQFVPLSQSVDTLSVELEEKIINILSTLGPISGL